MLENKDNILKKLNEILDDNLKIKYIEKDEIKKILIDNKYLDSIIDVFAEEIYQESINYQNNLKLEALDKYNNVKTLKKYKNIDILIAYMYYEYNLNYQDFMNLIKLILEEENPSIIDDLVNDDLIKIVNNEISLSTFGITVAVNLGLSLEDTSRNIFVEKTKQKIKK